MISPIRAVGSATIDFLAETGQLWRLALDAFSRGLGRAPHGPRLRVRATISQCVRAGYDSLPLVALISLLVGMIIALQSAYQLEKLGAANLVSNLVAISVTRELAPLLVAIIVAGRVGSAIAAELGTMKVSQEIDALTVMGLDPISYLVLPRILALLVCLPALTVFADGIGILGGLLVAVGALDMGAAGFVAATVDALEVQDLTTGMVKSLAFALIIGLVGCHQGLATSGGAEEVGRATTVSVVRSIVLIILADLFVTAVFFVRG